ncbi:hypothetical protein AB0E63_41450 [Kribbella sp. NPDC026596]|uniref:hypothetical protein n=1 Tax=Kribbella sp. NPDC026596 TaxID=3155122 RepID=UPI0033FABD37
MPDAGLSDDEEADRLRGRVAFGFISMTFVRDAGELLATHRKLIACATERGYRLGTVYVQRAGPPDAVFDLLGSLLESDGLSLVVPTLHHLAILGNPLDIRDHLSRGGHQVLIATEPAERTC